MNDKKICFVNTSKTWGGGESWQLETILSFRNKAKVISITSEKSELHAKIVEHGVENYTVKAGKFAYLNPFKFYSIYRMLKKLAPDTILFNTSNDFKLFTMPAKMAGIKNIIYRRDNGRPLNPHPLNKLLLRRGITHFVPCSQYIADVALSRDPGLFPKDKIRVIYNSIDIDKWDKQSIIVEKEENDDFIFGCVGRLSEEKGVLFLPEIARKLKDKGLKFKIKLAGTGPLHQELLLLMAKHGVEKHIEVLGFRDDVKSVMNSIDCLLIPSHWEGLPTVAIEAMASRKPVISFGVAGNPEVVKHDETGYLVPAFDLDHFSQKMEHVVNNPELSVKLGVKGRKLAETVFSREVTNLQLHPFLVGLN
ncbi:MAG: glycosyltransferase [Prolixibacteraceae bacterium]|jgi:glycosyltransferase involved in cell wall biosynthesis|nr:glycosyltransferase [Prolixibacteraceae bacterium]